MKLFQNSGCYPSYMPRLNKLAADARSFDERRSKFIADGYSACHLLWPVARQDSDAFFTNGDDEILQRMWAREHGMSFKSTLAEILLAQLEHHRTEVFYNLDPMRYGTDFLKKLPSSVKVRIAWRAVPSDLSALIGYDLMVCNFPTFLKSCEKEGVRTAYFTPSHSEALDVHARNEERPVDVLFVGGYTQYHRNRASVLEAVAGLRNRLNVVFHLDCSRLVKVAESALGHMLPLAKHRRPADIRAVSAPAVFGGDLYSAFSRAKIVINGGVDMAGNDRGNMRCFEAMGCGALMLTDEGVYPDGFVNKEVMLTYGGPQEAASTIERILHMPDQLRALASHGHEMVRTRYSKEVQWRAFLSLVDACA